MSKPTIIKIAMDFLEMMFIGTAVFFILYIFIAQPLLVTGNSMVPTFLDGEQILAEKISVKANGLTRGEIVVFKHPLNQDRLLIKRVIGLPNDIVLISNNKVIVNGTTLDEPYLSKNVKILGGRIIFEGVAFKVPADSYVVMGDNRNESSDSRDFGPVSKDLVVGKAFLIFYPLNHFKLVDQH